MKPENRDVAQKLGVATGLMFTIPILVFYACLNFVFHEKDEPTMWAGGAAVIATNIIVGGYVVSAFSEEDDFDGEIESKDANGPRVGAFKTRTD
jgi:hypothetical protein